MQRFCGRKVNIFSYEQARLDNSMLWERPAEWIDIQIRGLVFVIWASRVLNPAETAASADMLLDQDNFFV